MTISRLQCPSRGLALTTRCHAASQTVLSSGVVTRGGSGPAPKMRRLILLRHADSETMSKVRDHDRPISKHGKAQSVDIATTLKRESWIPDLVLASNSKRTKQTLDQMAQVLPELNECDTHLYGTLYTVAALDGQTKEHLCECLLEVVDDTKNWCVMCVGHNKGWEEAATAFAGQVVKLKTASAALFQCAASSWREALAGEHSGWQLVAVATPGAGGSSTSSGAQHK